MEAYLVTLRDHAHGRMNIVVQDARDETHARCAAVASAPVGWTVHKIAYVHKFVSVKL
jgi:hypothetical protein